MIRVVTHVRLVVPELSPSQLEDVFDRLGDALIERQGERSSLLDHSLSADLGLKLLEISVTTEGRTEQEAEALADFYVEDAIVATGGVYTPRPPEAQISGSATPFRTDVQHSERELVGA